MNRELESRRRHFGAALFFVVAIALLLYLAFAALHSEFGLIRMVQIEEQEKQLRDQLAGLRAGRDEIAAKTSQLSGDQPNLDLLDERARSVLGLGRPDELLLR